MANINNKRKRPKIRLQSTVIAPKVIEEEVLEPILEEPTEEVEKQSPVECRVAQVVVAIVAKRHVYHSAAAEVFDA